MECPKPNRCPNKTTCNKKTNMCTPKTVRCARGTKKGTVTKTCDLIPKKSASRCPAGSRRNNKTGDCENDFITLCKKHIMVPTLDGVVQTSYLTHKDCTVFLIGEKHQKHIQCTEILEMFKELIKENKTLSNPVSIDILIELLQYDMVLSAKFNNFFNRIKSVLPRGLLNQEPKYEATDSQLNNVRMYFLNCSENKNCDVRVHWTDPIKAKFDDKSKNIHDWLHTLAQICKPGSDDWTKNKTITDMFLFESDMPKLLTENRLVVKEIEKAAKINPAFTLDFCIKLFMESYSKFKKQYPIPWQKLVGLQIRAVMDFYTVARIIKSKMKHVIFYAGHLHYINVTTILNALDFKLIHSVDGKCSK